MRAAILACAAIAALAGCVSHEPRLRLPEKTQANCESRSVKQTAIESIVASLDDTPQSEPYPGDAREHAIITSVGGTFAEWTNGGGQKLRLPKTAKAFGVDGDYVMLQRAIITNEINAAEHARPVWLTFATPAGPKTVREKAYDIQDVCIEGRREI